MNRPIAIVVVAALLLGAGWFAFRRDHTASVHEAPAVAHQAAQPIATVQSTPATDVSMPQPTSAADVSSLNKSVVQSSGSPDMLKDKAGHVLEELIQSKQDGSMLRKLYSYDESGNLTRESYVDPKNGHIVECKDHFIDANGRVRVRITSYDGRELPVSAVQ